MEDFESTPEFQALIVAAAGKPERSMGDAVIPAEPPQWTQVRSQALSLLETAPRQLPVHVYLIQAEASVNGFIGLQQRLQTLVTLLQNEWDEVQPGPDEDDPDDPWYARVNLVNELAGQPMFLDTLHRLPLVSARGIGAFSARDMEIAAGSLNASEEDKARCQEGLIRGAFAESTREELQQRGDALESLPILCRALEAVFEQHGGDADVPSLRRLIDRLEECQRHFQAHAGAVLTDVDAESDVHGDTAIGGSMISAATEIRDADEQAGSDTASGNSDSAALAFDSRQQIMQAFDAILIYYQQHEPSSPVRVLTFDARSMVNKSFFELLQALAPTRREDLPGLLATIRRQPLAELLSDSFARHLAGQSLPQLEVTGQAPSDNTADEAGEVDPGNSGNSHRIPVVDSRQQVLALLQDIETWFLHTEPASPLPLVIADIRRLVPGRFTDLVAEFARLLPDAAADGS